jgi:hypothetical protein
MFKIFVSPAPECVSDALHGVIDVLAAHGAPAFKFGCDVYSVLRPDKIVVYFDRAADMRECAAALGQALDGIPAQGVPFSAQLHGDGLVSWGIDPPDAIQPLESMERESWRIAVTARLARSLLIARHSSSASTDRVRFALDRLALEGIDVTTWAPDEP